MTEFGISGRAITSGNKFKKFAKPQSLNAKAFFARFKPSSLDFRNSAIGEKQGSAIP